jgi:hypothetical protein
LKQFLSLHPEIVKEWIRGLFGHRLVPDFRGRHRSVSVRAGVLNLKRQGLNQRGDRLLRRSKHPFEVGLDRERGQAFRALDELSHKAQQTLVHRLCPCMI